MKAQHRCQILTLLMPVMAFIFSSCSKESSTANGFNAAGPKPVYGVVVYRTNDGKKVITLTSADELEMSENGINLVCKYTKQDDAMRVVVNSLGTTHALYFKITPQGLRGADGTIFLSPQGFQKMEVDLLMKPLQKR